MDACKTLLILEGGGLRGVFTSGVLEAFLEAGLTFDEVYGVSAGASNAVTYLAGQRGRNKRVFIDYIQDPRYMGFKSWLTTGNFFNKTFIFEQIPNVLDPFDYDAFNARKSLMVMPVTDAKTGKTVFLSDFSTAKDLSKSLKAATSLPILARPELFGDARYYDGGISCPLIFETINFSSYKQVVYILTQPKGYTKLPSKHPLISRTMLMRYPAIAKALEVRHQIYNQTLAKIEKTACEHPNFKIIRPDGSVDVARTETNPQKMIESYGLGYSMGQSFLAHSNNMQMEVL